MTRGRPADRRVTDDTTALLVIWFNTYNNSNVLFQTESICKIYFLNKLINIR